MKLVESKILDLNSKVREFFPYELYSRFTIRDLLAHRSGLTEWRPFYAEIEDSSEIISFIAALPLRYNPGEDRHYSDLGFILLGEIIKQVTSVGLEENFARFVRGPLNLSDTTYAKPVDLSRTVISSFGDQAEMQMLASNLPYKVDTSVNSFKRWRNYPLQGEINDGNSFHLFGGVAGHSGLFSTPKNLSTFVQELVSGDYFSELANFCSEKSDPSQALGFARYKLLTNKGSEIGFGHTGFPGVAIAFFPESKRGLVLCTNRLLVQSHPIQTISYLDQLLTSLINGEI